MTGPEAAAQVAKEAEIAAGCPIEPQTESDDCCLAHSLQRKNPKAAVLFS